jgi:xylulokinase
LSEREGVLLAVDVGTTTTRCVIFDLDGNPVGEAYREPPVHYPKANWAEVDPEDWWTAAVAAIREALALVEGTPQNVLGVGLCGLKHTVVPVGSDGKPLANAMLWMDKRCQPQAERMQRDHSDLIAGALGRAVPISTTPSAPKMRWIAENQPDLLRRTAKFLLAKDFIRYRLTETLGTDPSDASGTALYDRRSGDWASQMLDLVGVSRSKMPPIYASTAIAGGVTEGAARITGLVAGTPVVMGGGDVSCTLIGANALYPDAEARSARGCLYLGTAAWLSVARPRPSGQFFSADAFGATATTGASLKWLVSLLGTAGPDAAPFAYDALIREAVRTPLGARGLIFLPHLMGERAPECRPEAKGALFGLTLAHAQGDIARAVLEGCAFQLRRIAEALGGDLGEIVVVGGGAKSMPWVRMISDVLGVPLLTLQVPEAGALGAAILAGVGVGLLDSVPSAAQRWVRIAGRVEPDPSRHARYGHIYRIFQELERSVAGLYGRVPVKGVEP